MTFLTCYQSSPKVDNPHSVLYLSTGTLSQNQVGIYLKRRELEKTLPCSEHILGPLHLKILQPY